jgi:ribosomal silencing factor RsfS
LSEGYSEIEEQGMVENIDEKLSWEETYKEMAISGEDWSDWEIIDETTSFLNIEEAHSRGYK